MGLPGKVARATTVHKSPNRYSVFIFNKMRPTSLAENLDRKMHLHPWVGWAS